jgi:hypothetical protein
MAKKYKINGSGVYDTEKHRSIPNSMDNRHWREYQEWLADGNTPDPEFTQAELDFNALQAEVADLKGDLARNQVWLFRMIVAIFQVGRDNQCWIGNDFDQEIEDKAVAWKQKLDRLAELGE